MEVIIGFKYDHHALCVLDHRHELTLFQECAKHFRASQSFDNIINKNERQMRELLCSAVKRNREYSRSRSVSSSSYRESKGRKRSPSRDSSDSNSSRHHRRQDHRDYQPHKDERKKEEENRSKSII